MNDQDLTLIVDLIESQLSNSEAESALARIMADPELSAAYAEQLAVHVSLTDLPIASMTAAEKDALNTALVSQLQLEAAAAVVPIAKKRKAWWMPIAGIATAAAAVTAIFIMPGLSGSDDSSADTTIIASAAAEAPEDPAARDSAAQGSTADDGASQFDAAEEELLAARAPVTVVELGGADLVEVLEATAGEESPEAVQDQLNALGYTESASVDADVLAECISQISGQLPPNATGIVLFGVDSSGPTQIAHLGIVFDDGIGGAMSVDLETCIVVSSGS
jgi:hypothetical protein